MAIIKSLNGITPRIGSNCFLAETAVIVGDVEIGDDCSIWYGAVLRGDVNPIRIGNRVNVQECAVLHATYQETIVEIGDDVTIGHNAIVHGAKVGNNVLIGMGSIIMDHAVVADNTVVGAGAFVPLRTQLDSGVYTGMPAKKIRNGSDAITNAVQKSATGYLMYKEWYNQENE